jgi:DNA invertase Pin-like site-specific DNA recombinase
VGQTLNSPNKPKAIGYARVSSRRQAEEGGSIEAQRQAIIREAVLGGFYLVDVYADEGISGGKDETRRPGLSAALEAIKSGTAEALIVRHADRLARGSDLAGYFREEVRRAGARLVVISETTDPMRLAELMRLNCSQRMKTWNADRRAKGLPAGPPPYGYRIGEDGKLEPEPSETPTVERIIELRKDDATLRAIAAELNRDGIPTRSGAPWSAQMANLILRRAGAENGQ